MNTSGTTRPTSHGVKSAAASLVAPVSAMVREPDLDWDLCDQFSQWLGPELDLLVEQHASFVTPFSLKRSQAHR